MKTVTAALPAGVFLKSPLLNDGNNETYNRRIVLNWTLNFISQTTFHVRRPVPSLMLQLAALWIWKVFRQWRVGVGIGQSEADTERTCTRVIQTRIRQHSPAVLVCTKWRHYFAKQYSYHFMIAICSLDALLNIWMFSFAINYTTDWPDCARQSLWIAGKRNRAEPPSFCFGSSSRCENTDTDRQMLLRFETLYMPPHLRVWKFIIELWI